jgi:hypothetical protein
MELLFRFGEGNVEPSFADATPLEQKLQSERGLAGTGHAFDEVKPVGGEPAPQDFVES